MTLEGTCSVAEYLSHMQNRKPAASHILMTTLSHKRKRTREYIVNILHVTINQDFNSNK